MLTLTTALWVALSALVNQIAVAVPADISIAAGWIMPGNIAECTAAIIAAKVVRFTYDLKVSATRLRAS